MRFEIEPKIGLGDFILGMNINQVLTLIKRKGYKYNHCQIISGKEKNTPTFLYIPSESISLRFNYYTQNLELIEKKIITFQSQEQIPSEINKTSEYYYKSKLFYTLNKEAHYHRINYENIAKIFGLSRVPKKLNKNNNIYLEYAGIGFYFTNIVLDMEKSDYLNASTENSSVNTDSLLSKVLIFKEDSLYESLNEKTNIFSKRSVLITYDTNKPKSIKIKNENNKIVIKIGDHIEDVLRELKHPNFIHYTSGQDENYNSQDNGNALYNQPSGKIYYLNYFQYGFDIMISNNKVNRIIIHTNQVDDSKFGIYDRCNFKLKLRNDYLKTLIENKDKTKNDTNINNVEKENKKETNKSNNVNQKAENNSRKNSSNEKSENQKMKEKKIEKIEKKNIEEDNSQKKVEKEKEEKKELNKEENNNNKNIERKEIEENKNSNKDESDKQSKDIKKDSINIEENKKDKKENKIQEENKDSEQDNKNIKKEIKDENKNEDKDKDKNDLDNQEKEEKEKEKIEKEEKAEKKEENEKEEKKENIEVKKEDEEDKKEKEKEKDLNQEKNNEKENEKKEDKTNVEETNKNSNSNENNDNNKNSNNNRNNRKRRKKHGNPPKRKQHIDSGNEEEEEKEESEEYKVEKDKKEKKDDYIAIYPWTDFKSELLEKIEYDKNLRHQKWDEGTSKIINCYFFKGLLFEIVDKTTIGTVIIY